MSIGFKHFVHRNYLAIVALSVLAAVALTVALYIKGEDWKILVTVIGGLFSFVFLIQKQQLEEARLFKELFVEFNKRYDTMNEELNRIKSIKDKELSPTDLNMLYDYFNLCAEEFLFYIKGYIYPEVWAAWCSGIMDYFNKSNLMRKEWEKEQTTKSYYGLTLDKIEKYSSQSLIKQGPSE